MNSVVITCLILFFGRILDVSFGTLRMLSTVGEKRWLAALYGFFEVFLWFVVVRDALNNTEIPVLLLAACYAAGYSCGTLVGSVLSKYLVSGNVTLEVITSNRSNVIPNAMREAGYGLTVLNVNESEFGQPKYMIIADVDKKRVKIFEDRVKELDPGAFIMVRDTKAHIGGFSRAGK